MGQSVGSNLIRRNSNGTKTFPWRSVTLTDEQTPQIPLPPRTRATAVSTRIFGRQEQEKTSPLGNPQDYTDQVPVAPNTDGMTNPTEQKPALYVQSNATDPDLLNQQRPSSWCNLGPVQRLIGTTRNGTQIGGFAQFGYHESDIPYFNDREDRLNLHQMWTYFDRPAARCSNWSLGYRLDLVYGVDGPNIQSLGNSPTGAPSGWDNGWDFGSYGWAMPQAYLEMANCQYRIRAGRFLSPFGYEQVPSVENFFYSRTYTRNYTEPFGHTGILALNDVSSNGYSEWTDRWLGHWV
ncbi:MAG: outer membrane beta-barrel protein [Pirellulaceae bacterium]